MSQTSIRHIRRRRGRRKSKGRLRQSTTAPGTSLAVPERHAWEVSATTRVTLPTWGEPSEHPLPREPYKRDGVVVEETFLVRQLDLFDRVLLDATVVQEAPQDHTALIALAQTCDYVVAEGVDAVAGFHLLHNLGDGRAGLR